MSNHLFLNVLQHNTTRYSSSDVLNASHTKLLCGTRRLTIAQELYGLDLNCPCIKNLMLCFTVEVQLIFCLNYPPYSRLSNRLCFHTTLNLLNKSQCVLLAVQHTWRHYHSEKGLAQHCRASQCGDLIAMFIIKHHVFHNR